MTESYFNIFGDHHLKQTIVRQPLSNNENIGKGVTAPLKPNEPMKKGETKKSFLSNTGKALSNTPARQVFTPRAINVGALIYSDPDVEETFLNREEFEFTKPKYNNHDNYDVDLHDYIDLPMLNVDDVSPPNTPPPACNLTMSMDMDSSYNDDFFTDDFSNDFIEDDDLGLPEIF
ncbi:hypothetical protein ACJJTC_000212 [Scirpophaga incertulas]